MEAGEAQVPDTKPVSPFTVVDWHCPLARKVRFKYRLAAPQALLLYNRTPNLLLSHVATQDFDGLLLIHCDSVKDSETVSVSPVQPSSAEYTVKENWPANTLAFATRAMKTR